MATRAAVVVRWPPKQQICREFIEVIEEVMGPDKLSAGSGSGWMGDAEEPPKTKQRRAMYERPSYNQRDWRYWRCEVTCNGSRAQQSEGKRQHLYSES